MIFLDSLKMIQEARVEVFALPMKQKQCSKTLVLDLDETLVHSSLHYVADADVVMDLQVPDAGLKTVYVKSRPFLEQFL